MRVVPNDVAQDAAASLWIFRGPWMAALVLGCGVAFSVFRVLAAWGADLVPNLLISVVPILLVAGFVYFFVNDQAPSYPIDVFRWVLFGLRVRLYCLGAVRRPPELWVRQRPPVHFSEFCREVAA